MLNPVKTAFIFNLSGTKLNIASTSSVCKMTHDDVTNVCSWVQAMPSCSDPVMFHYQIDATNGLVAEFTEEKGDRLTLDRLETGVIKNENGKLVWNAGMPAT